MIPPLPETENAAVIRTDFTDDANYQIRWARGPDAPTGRKRDVRTNNNNNNVDNWRCYTYQVRETVEPLRHVCWRQP